MDDAPDPQIQAAIDQLLSDPERWAPTLGVMLESVESAKVTENRDLFCMDLALRHTIRALSHLPEVEPHLGRLKQLHDALRLFRVGQVPEAFRIDRRRGRPKADTAFELERARVAAVVECLVQRGLAITQACAWTMRQLTTDTHAWGGSPPSKSTIFEWHARFGHAASLKDHERGMYFATLRFLLERGACSNSAKKWSRWMLGHGFPPKSG